MKAIILAAGQGTRIKKYTQNLPKGMLKFDGKTIIERQIETYKVCGIDDIIVVRGFEAGKINYPGIKYYENLDYKNTNMVESLMCASEEFDDDVIVSYSDILFEKRLLEKMMVENVDYGCAVDDAWQKYWTMRYGKVDFDTESLAIDADGNITELGLEAPSLEMIDSRYIGLLRFSKEALKYMVSIWKDANLRFTDKPWQQSGKVAKKAYMTDLLNAVIESGERVKAIRFNGGWIEFDTNEDYENATSWLQGGILKELIVL